MNDTTISSAKNARKPRRKKLWEIPIGYHCSVIGTCLRRSDLRKLARNKLFAIEPDASDYQIHVILVNVAGTKSVKSSALHKILDKKYKAMVAMFSKIKNVDALKKQWEQCRTRGSVAGSYWAIMTHPIICGELSATLYGQVHMMGHDSFEKCHRNVRLQKELQRETDLLKEVLVSERQHYLEEKRTLEKLMAKLGAAQEEKQRITKENEQLKKQLDQLKSRSDESTLSPQLASIKQQLDESRQRNAGLCGRIDALTGELEDSRDLFELASNSMDDLEKINDVLILEKQELQQEIVSLETALIFKLASSCNCEGCADLDTDRCPGPDLCGKTVLYVGGKHKMVPRYRQLVEKYGGKFIHHDGGKEESRSILPKMLTNADVVLCPVDCVSHDACNCVKKICKRYQKPFVMMRSSGLASLAKGLNGIIQ